VETTVVVTTVGGPWLTDQLEALTRQTRRPEQIVLVNNGPAGAIDDVLARWRPQLPELELVEDSAVSVCGYARNVGAAHARYPGLLFLDDDDVAHPGYVEAMGRALDDADLVAARIDLTRLNRPTLVEHWGDMQDTDAMAYHGFLPWVIGGACGVRREVFSKVGGFDVEFLVAEDTDFCWRAQLDAAAHVAFVPEAVLSYRLRTDLKPAFRQARRWAEWDAALHRRFRSQGLPAPGRQLRALLRWGRPLLVAVSARSRDDLVVAARLFGGCIGRLQGSVRFRQLAL
jgi:GT2 family glycosyltransferase